LVKFRTIKLDELRVRGKQKLSALAERRGWSATAFLPSDPEFKKLLNNSSLAPDSLLDYLRSRAEPRFFASFDNRVSSIETFKLKWPTTEQSLIDRAQRAVDGEFDLLGHSALAFGNPVDWHLEPLSGKRSPLVHWSSVEELDSEASGDKKFVWELNRHQHFVLLGQAYLFTKDERYATAFMDQLESWMDQNPPKMGTNWLSSLEIAFRSISWVWGLNFFLHANSLRPDVVWRAFKFIYLNARHIENYLSTYFSPNTHLTGEALGLFYIGTLFPEFKDAGRWRSLGRQILLEQLPIHVLDDGVYFEQSSYYHRYTADFYLHFLLLARINREELPQDVSQRLQSLLDHLMYITRPDGTMPLFGDDDGGRFIPFDNQPTNDARSTLASAAVVFKREDYKFISSGAAPETLWLLGPEAIGEYEALPAREPAQTSIGFGTGGYYVMRESWRDDAHYLLFDCGKHGVFNCGHAHADALAFDLAAFGRTVLVDPGTFSYTGHGAMRDWFRSSFAHNTLTIDDQPSSIPAGPFSWKDVAKVECTRWLSKDRFDLVEGKHDGYSRLESPVDHQRSVLFLKSDYWIVRDQLRTGGRHQVKLGFHFDSSSKPQIKPSSQNCVVVSERDGKKGLDLAVFGQQGSWLVKEDRVSHCYGTSEPAATLNYADSVDGDSQLVTFLLPQDDQRGVELRVREIGANGGRAFEVKHGSGLDIVILRDPRSERVDLERMSTDADWAVVRFVDDSRIPAEILLFAGSRLAVDQNVIFEAADRINYLTAVRKRKQFLIDGEVLTANFKFAVPGFDSVFMGESRE
jgi:Heparinase II/III-like protein/Heparinase II/III N-terminus